MLGKSVENEKRRVRGGKEKRVKVENRGKDYIRSKSKTTEPRETGVSVRG